MHLTTQQSYELLAKHGCYVTEVCDKCGQLLGHVRYTRKGDGGVWCSRECRGDVDHAATRHGGRPRKYRTTREAHAAKAELQRLRRNSPNEAKTPSNLFGNKGLASAKSASLVVPPYPAPNDPTSQTKGLQNGWRFSTVTQ
jgi:hypothetical protein